jgi:isopenicillin N synthase-like dioxygenase
MPAIAKSSRNFLPEPSVKVDVPTYLPPPGPPPNHTNEQPSYAPPPGPPPGTPKLVDFPFLSSEQLRILYSQGFARVYLPPDHALLKAATALFSTSHAFFDQTSEEKQKFHRSNLLSDSSVDGSNRKGQSSEQGWSYVEDEKEMLTIRTSQLCPPEVTDNVRNLWQECGNFMQAMVRAIEASLGLNSGAFDNVVTEECLLPVNEIHETLLRMFRYERASDPRIVSEKHRDIGILSLVIGSSPGLEVWNNAITQKDPLTGVVRKSSWVPIEEDGNETKEVGGLTFTFLVGETLTALSNDLYKPGIHRVSVPPADPSSSTNDAKYRYSIVFALRPHRQGTIYTPSLTTAVTGPFKWPPMDENGVIPTVKAVDLFNVIANRHWSVNDSVEEREAKKIRLEKEREL